MTWTKRRLLLAILLVVTGSLNTLFAKWADILHSPGSDGIERPFQHPFLQTSAMFFGEAICLIVYKLRKKSFDLFTGFAPKFNPLIFLPPAFLDLVGTSIMYIGLNLTYANSFQMLRGSIIIFTATLSIIFLDRYINIREWIGILIIICGLVTVGVADFTREDKSQNMIITGDLLIVIAQVVSAAQMVYEEKYVSDLNVHPLNAVGWEGVFGFIMIFFLQIALYFVPAVEPFGKNARHSFEDSLEGLVQIYNNYYLVIAIAGTIVSISFFNFAGLSVTKEMSATTRMVLDSVRTLFIWAASLGLRWQIFSWPQLVGFLILILGMCVYNNIFTKKITKKIHLRDSLPPSEPISIYNFVELDL